MNLRLFAVLTITSLHISGIVCDYSILVDLNSISNPDGRLSSGSHCSIFFWIGRQCNMNLKICVESLSQHQSGSNACATGFINLGQISQSQNIATFQASTTYGGWFNPKTIAFHGVWQGSFIKFVITNQDSSNLIDVFEYQMTSSNTPLGKVNQIYYNHARSGVQPVSYQFKTLVQCTSGSSLNCGVYSTTQSPNISPTSSTPGWTSAALYLNGSIDTTANPCTNFYKYACGKRNPTYKPYGLALGTAQEQALLKLNQLLTTINPNDMSKPSAVRKAATLYSKCNNQSSTNRFNLDLMKLVKSLDSWPMINANWSASCRIPYCAIESYDMLAQTGLLQSHHNLKTLLSARVEPDAKNPAKNIMYISPGTLYYQAPEYYTNPTLASIITPSYTGVVDYLARFFASIQGITDLSHVTADIQNMISFETRIASFYQLPIYKRNMTRKYHKMTKGQMKARWPMLNFEMMFLHYLPLNQLDVVHNITVYMPAQNRTDYFATGRSWNDNNTVIVEDMDYIDNLNHLASTSSPRDQQNYLIWRYISSRLYFLGESVIRDTRKMFGAHLPPSFPQLFETKDTRSSVVHQITCTYLVSVAMPYATSRIYGQGTIQTVPGQSINNVTSFSRNAFRALVNSSLWLDAASKANTMHKLQATNDLGSYPYQLNNDGFLNAYSNGLNIWNNDTFLLAYEKALQNQHMTIFNTLLMPASSPYSFKLHNSIVFLGLPKQYTKNDYYLPQSFLQAPFYDPSYPMAVNMGGAGNLYSSMLVTMFDDIGLQYDANGLLTNMLDAQSKNALKSRLTCFADQYSQICPQNLSIPLCVRGRAAMTYIISMNGALKATYNGYKAWVQRYGPEPRLPGPLAQFSMEQIFFLSYMQPWCTNYAPDQLLGVILQGNIPHGPLSNAPLHETNSFSQAFSCPTDNPNNQCSVW